MLKLHNLLTEQFAIYKWAFVLKIFQLNVDVKPLFGWIKITINIELDRESRK
jgi:hypothetical protein